MCRFELNYVLTRRKTTFNNVKQKQNLVVCCFIFALFTINKTKSRKREEYYLDKIGN